MRTHAPLALAVLAILAGCSSAPEPRVHRVERGDLVVSVETSGTLQAVDSSAISAPIITDFWDYKISWMAPESSEVKKGQPVLRFDASELEHQLEKKRGEHDSAAKEQEKKVVDLKIQLLELDLKLAEARAALGRSKLKNDTPESQESRIVREKARLDLELAEAELKALQERRVFTERAGQSEIETLRQKSDRARQRVEELERSIGNLNVTAPRDGLVIYRQERRGEKRKVGDQVGPWERVLEIPDLRRMRGDAEVDEADAGRIAVDQRVTLRLESLPDHEYVARVQEIAPIVASQGQRSPLKVYRVNLELEATDLERMRPGMRFRGDVEVERKSNVVLVPLEAVAPGTGGPTVRLMRGGESVEKQVELGARNKTMVEVIRGLEPGDSLDLEPKR